MRKTGLIIAITTLAVTVAVGLYGWRSGQHTTPSATEGPANGGRIVATYRTEPGSFNRYVSAQAADDLVARLVHATLVRLDRTSGRLEHRLAARWASSPDGLTWTLALRDDVAFSDGEPFSSADVLFSFQALYDPKVDSQIASSLRIDGKPLQVRALDAHTVAVVFPAPYAPGITLLDALPILPAHKLRKALESGTFREAWGLMTPPNEIVGLGPFVLQEHLAGQRLVFAKNPKFWERDASGRPLPYVDQLELQITPDQNAEILRLQAGESDLMTDRVRVEDLASLEALSTRGQITLRPAGVSISPDMLWFNLDPASASAREHPWLQREEFRRAINQAVNRAALVNTIFLGEAVEIGGPITPGHGDWYLPDLAVPAFDPGAAANGLAAMGLVDRNGDGLREDDRGRTASFTLLTVKGHSVRERSAAMIQEQLRQAGVKVDLVPLEARAMIGQWSEGRYDAIYFSIEFDSFDPARNLDFWLSSGPFHFWRPSQPSPGTAWEAKIDALMTRQSTTLDPVQRRQLFADAQRVLAEHVPVLYFAAPKVTVATSARVGGVTPSVLAPNVLWNAERLYVRPGASDQRR
jgi:peptide/nickel transport system substrate-binding protein